MPTLHVDGTAIEVASGQTVLDALLEAGRDVPHACRAGACQSCLLRCTDGEPTAAGQQALKPTLRQRGYFLACMEKPTDDLHVSLEAAEDLTLPAEVVDLRTLSHDVVALTLEPAERFDHRPGQFLNLVRPDDGLVRSYSIASTPGWQGHRHVHVRPGPADAAGPIELHVRRLPGGRMSNWIATDLSPGDWLHIRGPAGDCFYTDDDPDQPLLLAGTGTGLAPLWAIARDALGQGHRGPIVLYHGARDASGLYMVDELAALAAAHPNVSYHQCLLEANGRDDTAEGDTADTTAAANAAADRVIIGPLDQQLGRHGSLAGWRVFLCGDPTLVNAMRKRAFLAGASMQQIHADAFVTQGS